MLTLSIVNLIEIRDDYNNTICDSFTYRYYTDYTDCRRDGYLWPLGAGLWPVPVTFALLVGMIHCQRMQRNGNEVSKPIAVIKALLMVHIGVSLVSIIIELIQLFASKDLQFVFKILIVFCLLVQLAYSISVHRYFDIHKKEYTLEMDHMMSQSNPICSDRCRHTSSDNGARQNAIINVVHPTIGQPQMIDCNTITETNNNSGKCSVDEPPTYGQTCSYQSI